MMSYPSGQERPTRLIDRLENVRAKPSVSLTADQCWSLWTWIEDLEDEVIHAREALAAARGLGPVGMHDGTTALERLYEGGSVAAGGADG